MLPAADFTRFLAGLQPVTQTPWLRTLNGTGITMLGRLAIPGQSTVYVSMLWITLLFIPVMPLGVYVVSSDGQNFRFHGRSPMGRAFGSLGWAGMQLLATSIAHAAIIMALVLGALYVVVYIFGARTIAFRG